MKRFQYFPFVLMLSASSAFCEPVTNEDEAIRLATEAIHKFHLTTLRDECGLVNATQRTAYFEIVVRERHTAECGGSPETGPRLFTVRVRKRDGHLTSDVYDGTNYKPVDHELSPAK